MMRRGFALLGGTFDPVHRGHLALAEAALEALPILRVDFLPAGDPWQKKRVTSAFHRVTMLRRALQYDPRFRVDEREVLRLGKTYTIDTLEAIRRRTGDSIPVVLLLGSDQWNNFSTWVRWREITDFAHIAVAAREGVETAPDEAVRRWAAERTVEPRRLSEKGAGYVTFFSMPPHRTSATAVRRTLATQPLVEALKRLERDLPPAVVQYVLENGLYRPISYRQKQT